jgi:cardiolipin synthase
MLSHARQSRWRAASVPREWRTKLAPRVADRTPKGRVGLWLRVRRFLLSWWAWAFVAIAATVMDEWWWAIGTGLMAFVCFLLTPSERAPCFGLDHQFDVDDPQFIPSIGGVTGEAPAPGNRVDLLNNGCEFYPAMLEAIRGARASITIEAYIYWSGEIGVEFARALAERARAGVPVKILLDAVGSSTIGSEILKILEGGGCQLAWFNPVRWYSIGRFNHRTHRKSLIVDGRIGFTGGAGIADHWLGNAEDPAHWRDIQVRVEGPCVVPLQTGFAHNWVQTTRELVSGDAFFPAVAPAGALAVITVMSSPEAGASSVRTMHYLSIASARQSIFIANPYFVPDATATAELIEAKRRGVDVRIMVSGRHNDNQVARRNSTRLIGPLLRAGIEILEYNKTMLHQKTMVIDGVWATVGTTNFDSRSFAHNEENNVCVYDKAWARRLHDVFLADVSGCERVTLESWKRRSLSGRAMEILASFLEEQA